jgi:hypothetical protein
VVSALGHIADSGRDASLATACRRSRFALFLGLLSGVPRPVRILDVGGTEGFWAMMGAADLPGVEVLLLNLRAAPPTRPAFRSLAGDARNMAGLADRSFDVVFSNSVLEHVGTFDDQKRAAAEMRRVGRRYFIQTPNRYFPLEPHFLFPFFQFLPMRWRVALLTRRSLGWVAREPDPAAARRRIAGIRLLTGRELRELFPEAALRRERFCGLTKSFIACYFHAASR